MGPKTGILILNLGSPDAPTPKAVGRYLTQFLTDRYVIDIPAFFRQLLVRFLIVPRRSSKSAAAYAKIWGAREASPLVTISDEFREKLQLEVGVPVRMAMRYGRPDLTRAIQQFQNMGVEKLIFWPLYPQFSTSATQSAIEEFQRLLKKIWPKAPTPIVIRDFYNKEFYLDAVLKNIKTELNKAIYDHVLVSFHSLPNAQLKKWYAGCETPITDEGKSCCDQTEACVAGCYRAQSLSTYRFLKSRLGTRAISLSFQSRLGVREWLKPATDEVIPFLAQNGIKRLLVVCPGFVTDNLETLEEIAIRGRESFIRAGGEELKLVPCPNAELDWVRACAGFLKPL